MRRSRLARTMLAVALMLAMVPLSATAATTDYGYLTQWGGLPPGPGDGQFSGPWGLDVGLDGSVYVGDLGNGRIQHFAIDGTYLSSFGTTGTANGKFNSPQDVAVGPDGSIYVADIGNNRIQKFDSEGHFITKWGGVPGGPGDGEFLSPFSVAVGPDGSVYVCDLGNNRIQKFDSEGHFITKWGGVPAGSGDGEFLSPFSIAVGPDGSVYVVDIGNNRIQKFDSEGHFITKWGGLPTGPGDGEFVSPYGVDVGPDGSVYVGDFGNARVQHFDPDGGFIGKWNVARPGDSVTARPFGVVAGLERDVFVSDMGLNVVRKYFVGIPSTTTSLAGSNRYRTGVVVSREAYPDGLRKDSEGYKTVLIATGRNWPDALGGASLAGALDGPILLVDTDAVPAEVAIEIGRLGATRAIVIGGTSAVGEKVVATLNGAGLKVERIGGVNRKGTAEAVARRTVGVLGSSWDGTALVATADNFPDALAASPLAAAKGWPLYLSAATGLADSTKTRIAADGVTDAVILGGDGAVPPQVESALASILGGAAHVKRLDGSDRYATAVAVATFGVERAGLNWAHVALSKGTDFPDALCGGVLQGSDQSVLLLTRPDSLPNATRIAITNNKMRIYEVRYLGGTAVVTQAVRSKVESLLY